MDLKRLDVAIREAERFLERARNLRTLWAAGAETRKSGQMVWTSLPNLPVIQGAARRSSMDLTRSLAALRRLS